METPQVTTGQGTPRKAVRLPAPAIVVPLMVSAVLLAATVWAIASFGSIGRAVAYHLRGETLFLDANEKSVGTINRGETAKVTFKMVNLGSAPLRIVGLKTWCACPVDEDFPLTIAAGASHDLTVPIQAAPPPDVPEEQLSFNAELTLFTNNPNQSRVPIHVKGRVRSKPSPAVSAAPGRSSR